LLLLPIAAGRSSAVLVGLLVNQQATAIERLGNASFPSAFTLLTGRKQMDWNRVEGNWKEVQGKVKQKWAKLTDDDLTAINGQRQELEGRLQKR
jgi:uncharacterized protein YjbJ (UPF0337 family)